MFGEEQSMAKSECIGTSVQRSNKIRDKLIALKINLEGELGNINAAIAALDAHPMFEDLYDTLNKVVRRL